MSKPIFCYGAQHHTCIHSQIVRRLPYCIKRSYQIYGRDLQLVLGARAACFLFAALSVCDGVFVSFSAIFGFSSNHLESVCIWCLQCRRGLVSRLHAGFRGFNNSTASIGNRLRVSFPTLIHSFVACGAILQQKERLGFHSRQGLTHTQAPQEVALCEPTLC